MITPHHLTQVDSFDSLAKLFHDELRWPKEKWSIFGGVANLYGIDSNSIKGVEELKAVQKLDDTQSWGIFLVDFGSNDLKRSNLRSILNVVADRARQTHDNPTWPHDNILFICRSNWNRWTLCHYVGDKPATAKLKSFSWKEPNESRTVCERCLPELKWDNRDHWDKAWDVESLSDRFFTELRDDFRQVEALWPASYSIADRRTATQLLFNRLLFICFLQEKEWLEYKGVRPDYLFRLYDDTDTSSSDATTFSRKLEILFFSGLNTPNILPGDRELVAKEIGRVPFLNGGLFDRSSLDRHYLPNVAYVNLLDQGGLFRAYNFTIEEATPLDIRVAIDPEMLGKIFEELVNDRHETGSYYTPRPIVSFMCREALKGYLGGCEALVDDHTADGITVPEAKELVKKLECVKFCDPACGSGAYLVGMLQEIFALQRLLDTAAHNHRLDYERKKVIIDKCLYGVDLEEFAVNIAWLRIWLSLVIENKVNPLDDPTADVALPNLDLKLEVGDSVASGNPMEAIVQTVQKGHAQGGLDFEAVDSLTETYKDLRRQYQDAHGPHKRELSERIKDLREQIKARVAVTSFSEKSFLWPIEFPEVFLSDDPEFVKGFDIVLANPPYVRQEGIKQTMGDEYKKRLVASYPDTGSGTADLFIYFYDRGLQILKPGGMFVYISSNKWFKADYGSKLRKHVASTTTVQSIVDFGDLPVFRTALAYAMIFIARKTPTELQSPQFTSVPSLTFPYPDVKTVIGKYGHLLLPAAIQGGEWVLADADTLRKLATMRSHGTPLGEYAKGKIYYGIKTGLNEAFVINGETRLQLIEEDSKSAEIIRPLAVGKDIRRWHILQKDSWLIFAKRGIDIEKYPAVKNHLSQFREALEPKPKNWTPANPTEKWKGRKAGSYKWFEIQDEIAYFLEFEKPRIVYPDMSQEPRYAIAKEGVLLANTAYMICSDDKALLAILNSRPFNDQLTSLLNRNQGDTQRAFSSVFTKALVPLIPQSERLELQSLAQKILDAKEVDLEFNVSKLEEEINDRVEFLYFHQTGNETFNERRVRLALEEGTIVANARKLIEGGESSIVEFKQSLEAVDETHPRIANALDDRRAQVVAESRKAVIHSALKSVCAFRNSAKGGTLFLGVHDDKTIIGLESDYKLLSKKQDADGFENKLTDLIKTRLSPIPFDLEIKFITIDGKEICRLDVPPGPPTYLDNGLYVRLGNSTERLEGREAQDWLDGRR